MRLQHRWPTKVISATAVAAVATIVTAGPAHARAEESPDSSTTVALTAGISERKIWAACGISDDRFKLVRNFPRAQGNAGTNVLPAGSSDLHCGSENWGYRHILKNHRTQWEHDAIIVGRNWRDQADWAIEWVLRDPGVVTYRASNDTFCYSREVYLAKDDKVVATRRPHVVIARESKNIITAFPANSHCN